MNSPSIGYFPSSPSSRLNTSFNLQNNQISPNRFSSIDKESGLLKVADCLHKILKIETTIAKQLAEQIFEKQQTLQRGEAVKFKASVAVPGVIIVTKERIHCLVKKIGEGTYSCVFAATVIPTARHRAHHIYFSPGKPQTTALKVTKRAAPASTFTPEKENLRAVAQQASEGLDAFLDTFKDAKGIGYSLNVRFDTDLSHATFQVGMQPLQSMVKVLLDCAKGIKIFHDAGWIHRDIKGGNLLASFPSSDKPTLTEQNSDSSTEEVSEAKGAVTDFGLLQKQKARSHRTSGTPHYLDPTMFGDLEMTLINQKKRVGIQTKEGDIFALGITIFIDALRKFLIHAYQSNGKSADKVTALSLALKEKTITGPFSDEDLRNWGRISNYRIMHSSNIAGDEKLIQYPPLDFLQQTLLQAASELRPLLNDGEIRVLIGLINLSCLMQEPDLAKRPNISSTIIELMRVDRLMEDPNAQSVKRELRIDLDEAVESPSQKKARSDQAIDNPPAPESCAPTSSLEATPNDQSIEDAALPRSTILLKKRFHTYM
jgi:serine/threonine protein kinase